jgi:hypothetical protein
MNILTLNLLFSTLVFWIAARIYILPKLQTFAPRDILLPILILHAFRHLGVMFLAPGATYAGMPSQFALPGAIGDLVAAVLAVAAIPAVATQARAARPLVWLFNIEGTVDLLAAITLATIHDASPYMGPAYWIPAFWVPALLVTHGITFAVLLRHWPQEASRRLQRVGAAGRSTGSGPSSWARPTQRDDRHEACVVSDLEPTRTRREVSKPAAGGRPSRATVGRAAGRGLGIRCDTEFASALVARLSLRAGPHEQRSLEGAVAR